jgi:hypothetical protein
MLISFMLIMNGFIYSMRIQKEADRSKVSDPITPYIARNIG